MDIEKLFTNLIYWFKEVSKVPRNSGQEEKICEYVCNFAKQRNLEFKKDKLFNVIIKKPATKGLEGKDPIIFQAHLDMVCEKTKESTHNFVKDAIKIIENDETLTALDTTLGADDGIGVATLLLLLDEKEITHPDIYCLFTSQEESGMEGAKQFDYSGINAKYLINVDHEEEKTGIVGCAGGCRTQYKKELKLVLENNNIYSIIISGLHGGHSGDDINKNRINSNYLMSLILSRLENLQICSFVGGNKINAIPNYTEAIISTTTDSIEDIINSLIKHLNISEDDKNLKIEVTNLNNTQELYHSSLKSFISKNDSKDFINLLLNLKQGVIEFNKNLTNLVETSGNVGIVKLAEGKATISEMIRSSEDEKTNVIKTFNNNVAKQYGYSVCELSSYPGWKYTPNTKIEKEYIKAYKEVHNGKAPNICIIHAGLECGVIHKKMPHLQMISIGPDIKNAHTVKETLYLDSCKKYLNTLITLIERL